MKINEITEGTRCWKGYKKKGMKTMFGKRVPNCVKNESEINEGEERSIIRDAAVDYLLDEFGGDNWKLYADNKEELEQKIYSELSILSVDEIIDPNMEVGGQRIGNFANGRVIDVVSSGEVIDDVMSQIDLRENLRAWFGKGKKGGAGGGGWDRYNTKGERIGKCGDSKKGEGKPKCLSKSRAASLRAKGGKKAIAAAVRKKRRNDPNKNRRGKAKNVSNTTRKSK